MFGYSNTGYLFDSLGNTTPTIYSGVPWTRVRDAITDNVHGAARSGFETRPNNVYVNYIIKL